MSLNIHAPKLRSIEDWTKLAKIETYRLEFSNERNENYCVKSKQTCKQFLRIWDFIGPNFKLSMGRLHKYKMYVDVLRAWT